MRYSIPLFVLALTACGQQSAAPPENPDDQGIVKSSVARSSTESANAKSDVAESPEVTLTAEGIILIGAIEGRGTATTLEFRRDRKTVLDVMAVDFPAPKLSNNDECGAGVMEFAVYGPLTLNFVDGELVGWLAEKGDNVVTSDGIRPGATIGDLKKKRSVKMLDSTLDGEFEYASPDGGTIGGFASGKGDGATITSLYAGMNCFFR